MFELHVTDINTIMISVPQDVCFIMFVVQLVRNHRLTQDEDITIWGEKNK